MGWIRTTGIAVIGLTAAILAAPAVRAQETDAFRESNTAGMRQMLDKLQGQLNLLAEGTDIEVPDIGPIFAPMFAAAQPDLPEDADFSFSIGFNIKTSLTDGDALEPDEDRTPYHADAQACAADQPGYSVVYFERLVIEDGVGHHCVTVGPGEQDPEAWLLFASYLVETRQRRLESRFGAAAVASTDGISTYAEALAIGDPQVAALIAVSDQIGLTSTRILMASPLSDTAR